LSGKSMSVNAPIAWSFLHASKQTACKTHIPHWPNVAQKTCNT
jgi:hypothetical protein